MASNKNTQSTTFSRFTSIICEIQAMKIWPKSEKSCFCAEFAMIPFFFGPNQSVLAKATLDRYAKVYAYRCDRNLFTGNMRPQLQAGVCIADRSQKLLYALRCLFRFVMILIKSQSFNYKNKIFYRNIFSPAYANIKIDHDTYTKFIYTMKKIFH